MEQAADNEELLIRYLLGELSEEEQDGIEQRYISDPEFYEQLLIVEDDLIDAYAEGTLSRSRRKSFEGHFLRSPERQARVGFARAWMAYVSRQSKAARSAPSVPGPSFFGFLRFEGWPAALRVSAVSLVLLAGALLFAETLRLRNRFEQAEAQRAALENNQRELHQQIEDERRRGQELSLQLERERDARDSQTAATESSPSGLVSFLLTPGLVRGAADAKRLIIPPEARQVRLQVSFGPGDYDSYGVIIKTVDGREIWRRSGLKAQPRGSGNVLVVPVPAGVFTTEDYILTLNGLKGAGPAEDLSDYFFSVSGK